MKKNNANKKERAQFKKNIIAESQKGLGLFIFKNKNKEASLQLPKLSEDGKKWIGPNETWRGDSFFLRMIPKEALLVKTIISPDQQKNQEKEDKKMNEEKLILDQPDQITSEGKVEHVASNEKLVDLSENTKKRKRKKNENSENQKKLLTEDPIAGVTIIRD